MFSHPASVPDALTQALASDSAYVLGVFGRVGSLATARVLHVLSEGSHGSSRPRVLVGGGLAPVRTIRSRLIAELGRHGKRLDADASWSEVVRSAAASPGVVLLIDRAHLIEEADRRFLVELASGSKTALGAGGVPQVVLLSDDRRFLERLGGTSSPFYDPLAALTDDRTGLVRVVDSTPVPYGALALKCPRWPAIDVVRGAAVFGGQPEVLQRIDPDRSLGWNASRLLLEPNSALFDHVPNAVFARFQKTGRYGAVLAALANGAQTWQEVVRLTPEFGSGSPLGAYMKRLEERGFVAVRNSLDAAAGSRRKRYALADSLDAFWFRFVAPVADRLRARSLDPRDAWDLTVAPQLDPFVARVLPSIARSYLDHYAATRLGSGTRIVGGLWGEDHDFDVAGTLWDGSVVYGHCTWVDRNLGAGALLRTRTQMRETRFGFGRERRTVLLIMKHPPSRDLEHAALRDPNVEWLDAERLVEEARSA